MTKHQDEFDFDVFISYSSKDKEWVRGELLKRIEQAGLKAFIDYRDFTRGAPSIQECERGAVKCRKTLIVFTPNYLKSAWGEFENIMVQTLDPANRQLRLIPLLKAKCKKPLRIAALTHIDFTDDADLDLAWGQLLTTLGAPAESAPPKEPERDDWYLVHPYPMPPHFTGRVAEREMLTDWLESGAAHPLLVLRALGGFGKSALAWHWLLHDVAPAAWPRVVWWSFYEGDASFDQFLAETLQYLCGTELAAASVSARGQNTALLQALSSGGTLLVLDGFERVLRAFGRLNAVYQGDDLSKSEVNDRDCISPLAELFLRGVANLPNLRSKVLLTTRLCPRVLEAKGGGFLQGCREEELREMQPADAVAFFCAQGIRGTHTEIEQACEPYGYHPLSLSLLAGWIVRDLQQPGDIAAATRLDVSGDLVQRKHHVLETACNSLTPECRALLGRIACFRGRINYDALTFLAQTGERGPQPAATLDADLGDLVARGLLHYEPATNLFYLHRIVHRWAYDQQSSAERASSHGRLRDYFSSVRRPHTITSLDDLTPVIELFHHTIEARQFHLHLDMDPREFDQAKLQAFVHELAECLHVSASSLSIEVRQSRLVLVLEFADEATCRRFVDCHRSGERSLEEFYHNWRITDVKIAAMPIQDKEAKSEEESESDRSLVFVSYSHKDESWLVELQTLLAPVVRNETISLWDASMIRPGEKWRSEIVKALASAKVAVLLVSRNFLASDFIAKHELPPLLDAATRDGLKVVWILISDCLFQETAIVEYQAAHDISRPLDRLSKARQIGELTAVCKTIKLYAK